MLPFFLQTLVFDFGWPLPTLTESDAAESHFAAVTSLSVRRE